MALTTFGMFLLYFPFIFFGCGKKSTSEDTAAPRYLRIAMVSSGSATTATSLVENNFQLVDFNQFLNSSIASGTPEEMTLKVAKMTLTNSTTNASVPIFSDTAGKEISIKGSRVDISNLFTKISCVDKAGAAVNVPDGKTCKCGTKSDGTLVDLQADGSCPQPASGDNPAFGVMEVNQDGTFDNLTVEFSSKGTAKGCVNAMFAAGAKTYCTKTDQGLDASSSFQSSSFEAKTGTAQTVYWSKSGNKSETFTKSFPIGSTITISTAAETPKLTLVLDRGRMLRFYIGTGTNPGPDFPSSKAYFFSTVFEDSSYVFVGQPGDVKGYRFAAYAKKSQALGTTVPPATSRPCTGECTYVNGWVTIILTPEGVPMVASLMPDDDNAFTILKGANYDPANPGKILQSKLVANSSTSWDLNYNLISSGKTTGLIGVIEGLNPSEAVDSTQTATFYSSQLDTSNTTFTTWGEITLNRKL